MSIGLFDAHKDFILTSEFLFAVEMANLLTAFVLAIASIVFYSAARRHPEEKYLHYWAAWCGLYAASSVGYNIAGGLSTSAVLVELSAMFVGIAGLRRFFRRPIPWRIMAATYLLYAVMMAAFFDPTYRDPNAMKYHLAYYTAMSIPTALLLHDIMRWYTRYLPVLGWFSALATATELLVFLAGVVIYTLPYVTDIDLGLINRWATIQTIATVMIIAFMAFSLTWGNMMLFSERLQQRLIHLAETDTLTGLYNRRAFTSRATAALSGPSAPPHSTVLLLDIDHFKLVNDTYGHDAGDSVLSRFGALLGSVVPADGITARLGGEEFAVLLPGRSETAAVPVAEAIRRASEETAVTYGADTIRFTISAGMAQILRTENFGSALSRADAALYDAKHSGRNRIASSATAPGRLVWAPAA